MSHLTKKGFWSKNKRKNNGRDGKVAQKKNDL